LIFPSEKKPQEKNQKECEEERPDGVADPEGNLFLFQLTE
jgi:hypothetical protein